MIKLGFFVEGQTERIFLERFFQEYLTPPTFDIESKRMAGDKLVSIKKPMNHPEAEIFILIYEVAGGERVVGALLDRAERMINNADFNCLFALRDLHPNNREKKGEVVKSVQKLFSGYSFSKKLKHILAVMETEAWFLADYNLFKRIDSRLTSQYIKEKTGVDLVENDPEQYPHPVKTIKNIYRLIGKRYRKKESQIYSIVSNLDYSRLCITERDGRKISSFSFFLNALDDSLPN